MRPVQSSPVQFPSQETNSGYARNQNQVALSGEQPRAMLLLISLQKMPRAVDIFLVPRTPRRLRTNIKLVAKLLVFVTQTLQLWPTVAPKAGGRSLGKLPKCLSPPVGAAAARSAWEEPVGPPPTPPWPKRPAAPSLNPPRLIHRWHRLGPRKWICAACRVSCQSEAVLQTRQLELCHGHCTTRRS